MKSIFFFFFGCTTVFTACSQRDSAVGFIPEIIYKRLPVGQSGVNVRLSRFETDPPFLLLQLHSNETTAAVAAKQLAHKWGINLLQIFNSQDRLISFRHSGKWYQFDPNRIFSDEGIQKTLTLSSQYSEAALDEVRRFRDSLVLLLELHKPIVAVHNNTNGRFNILQYLTGNTGQVHINKTQDEDDFFLTNDEEIFQKLKDEKQNVVLEDASQMEEDGSLSLFCNRNNIRYINVEAQHGHIAEQVAMLEIVKRILR